MASAVRFLLSTLQRDAPSTSRPRLLHWLLPPPLAYPRPRPLHRREHSAVSVGCPLHRQHYCRTTTSTTRQAVSPFSSSAKKCRRVSTRISLATRHSSILYSFARRGMHSYPFFSYRPPYFPSSVRRFFYTPYLYHCPRRTLTLYLYLLFLLSPSFPLSAASSLISLSLVPYQGWLSRGDKFVI